MNRGEEAMNRLKKIPYFARTRRALLAGCVSWLLVACLFAPSASAQVQTLSDNCRAQWQSSRAHHFGYCPNAAISYIGLASDPAMAQKCEVTVTCSVEVLIGDESQTFSQAFTVYASLADTASLALCVTRPKNKDGDYETTLSLSVGCPPGSVHADFAARRGFRQ